MYFSAAGSEPDVFTWMAIRPSYKFGVKKGKHEVSILKGTVLPDKCGKFFK
jgi:hypothetical protein